MPDRARNPPVGGRRARTARRHAYANAHGDALGGHYLGFETHTVEELDPDDGHVVVTERTTFGSGKDRVGVSFDGRPRRHPALPKPSLPRRGSRE